jgi:hypothetical protein
MRKSKINKILLPIVGSIALPIVAVPTALSLTVNKVTQDASVDIATIILPDSNIGSFTNTPTADEVISRLREDYSTLYYNQIQCTSVSGTQATITPVTGSTIYSGTTNVTFSVTPTNTNSLLSFFSLSATGQSYNVTVSQSWLPTSTPTQSELFAKISNLQIASTKINLNQLEIKSGSVTN